MRRYSRESEHLAQLLKCQIPLIAAPMAGGPSTPNLAAAVSSQGWVGSIAGAYMEPKKFQSDLKTAKKEAAKRNPATVSINANLFVPDRFSQNVDWSLPENLAWLDAAEAVAKEHSARMVVMMAACREGTFEDLAAVDMAANFAFCQLKPEALQQMIDEESRKADEFTTLTRATRGITSGVDVAAAQRKVQRVFDDCVVAILEERPAAASFVFGAPDPAVVSDLKRRNIAVLGTATTVDEALELEAAGFDAIIAQGVEAGGHRGSFHSPACVDDETGAFSERATAQKEFLNPEADPSALPTLALVRSLKEALDESRPATFARPPLPIIAAGGIMCSDDIVSAVLSGAAGAQLGTAFLLSREAGSSSVVRSALRRHCAGNRRDTVMTRAFSGRWARGVRNSLTDAFEGMAGTVPPELPPLNDEEAKAKAAEAQLKKMLEEVGDAAKNVGEGGAPSSGSGGKKATKPASPKGPESLLPFPLQGDLIGGLKRSASSAAQSVGDDVSLVPQCQLAAAEVTNVWAGTNAFMLSRYDNTPATQIAASLRAEVDSMLDPHLKA